MWPMPSVYPSGAARTTRPTPMVPPAPVVLSTTTVWPIALVMRAAMMRAIVSVGPPAENGTTIVTGLAGKPCAEAASAIPQRTSTTAARYAFIVSSQEAGYMNYRFEPAVESMSRAKLAALQLKRLRQTVKNAYEHVPMHRKRMRKLGMEPGDLRSLAD